MARFLIRLSLFVALQGVIFAYVVHHGVANSEKIYFSAMNDKIARLESISGPRLIIAGGSNGAFGIHSQIVAEGIQKPPINVSLHAALGMDFYLQLLEDQVHEGDTVVLIPEYEMVGRVIHEKTKNQMKLACPQLWPYLAESDSKWGMAKEFLDSDALKTLHTWSYRAFQRKRNPQTVYTRSGFNEYGDLTSHYGLPTKPIAEKKGIRFDDKNMQEFIARLNRFEDVCQRKGAQVYLAFVPMNRGRFDDSKEYMRKFEQAYREGLNFPVLDRPEDYVFDDSLFYDTYYHLTREGGEQRSQILNQSLRTQMIAGETGTTTYR